MMRGDSLRDFYAKALALLGLAFLGALGAAVDYWPTNLSIPRTSELDFQIATLRPLSNVPAPPIAVLATRRVATRSSLNVTPVDPQPAATETVAMTIAAPEPVSTFDRQFAAPDTDTFSGLSTSESTIALTVPEKKTLPVFMAEAAPAPLGPEQKSGILGGIVASISDGGSKTGSAIANGFQAVGGAVGGAMKAGAGSIMGLFRHDQKQQRPDLGMLLDRGLQ